MFFAVTSNAKIIYCLLLHIFVKFYYIYLTDSKDLVEGQLIIVS